MRWVKLEGKGILHYSKYSMDREGFGDTMCGKRGVLVPVIDGEDTEARKCKTCRDVSEG